MKRRIRTFSSNADLVTKRRDLIIDRAMEVFAERGYDRTNMREVAEALGVTKGFVYHYIGSKEDILYLIINSTVERQKRFLSQSKKKLANMSPKDALNEAIKDYLISVDKSQEGYNFINHVMANLSYRERQYVFESETRVVDFFQGLLRRGIEAGEFKVEDTFLVAHIILLSVSAWAHRRWMLRRHYTLEEYTKRITEQILEISQAKCPKRA